MPVMPIYSHVNTNYVITVISQWLKRQRSNFVADGPMKGPTEERNDMTTTIESSARHVTKEEKCSTLWEGKLTRFLFFPLSPHPSPSLLCHLFSFLSGDKCWLQTHIQLNSDSGPKSGGILPVTYVKSSSLDTDGSNLAPRTRIPTMT